MLKACQIWMTILDFHGVVTIVRDTNTGKSSSFDAKSKKDYSNTAAQFQNNYGKVKNTTFSTPKPKHGTNLAKFKKGSILRYFFRVRIIILPFF